MNAVIRVEVKSTETVTRSGVKDGREWSLVEQRGWLHGAKDYPVEVSFILGKGQIPFAPGYYFVGPECCVINAYGQVKLELNRMKPIKLAEKAA